MDKRLVQKNEEMNILLNYKVSVVNYEEFISNKVFPISVKKRLTDPCK